MWLRMALLTMRRSPYGERGLKCWFVLGLMRCLRSLSLRRAWIEIRTRYGMQTLHKVALLTESVD